MNRLSKDERTKIIAALVEGNSLRATARLCDVAFNTVLKLLPEVGRACMEYQDKALRKGGGIPIILPKDGEYVAVEVMMDTLEKAAITLGDYLPLRDKAAKDLGLQPN